MDPDSKRVRVTVTDGRGRAVPNGGLARWLSGVVPARVRGEVAIALVPDTRIRTLNQQFRNKNAPTDVLSFPAEANGAVRLKAEQQFVMPPEPRPANREPRFLGDIVIATGVAKRQAREAGHAYATELRVLALHGLLHLLGYDHDDPDDAGRMARAESRLRRQGGLREGLIARTRLRRPAASHR